MDGGGGRLDSGECNNVPVTWKNLYQTDDDWPAVQRKIMRERLVWGRLGTLI